MKKTIYTDEYRAVILNLIRARHSCQFTQEEVARALEKPRSYVAKVENYTQRIDIVELKRFCDLYKSDLIEIIAPLMLKTIIQ